MHSVEYNLDYRDLKSAISDLQLEVDQIKLAADRGEIKNIMSRISTIRNLAIEIQTYGRMVNY